MWFVYLTEAMKLSYKLFKIHRGSLTRLLKQLNFEMMNFYDSGSGTMMLTRFKDIIEASEKKTYTYHCRNVVYALGLAPYDDIMYKLDKGVIHREISTNFLTISMLWETFKVGNYPPDF